MDEFRQSFNFERPHEALEMAVPGSVYEPSPKRWRERAPAAMEYPSDWQTRKVGASGQMKWRSQEVRITDALAGEVIGLIPF
jgi:hypothetical protein